MKTQPCARYRAPSSGARGQCAVWSRHLDDCPAPCPDRHTWREACGQTEFTCHGCQPRYAEHGRLCRQCYDGIRTALSELPAQWAALVEKLTPGGGASQGRVSGTPERGLPINPTVADHRDHIARVLTGWAMLQAEARPARPPRNPRPATTAHWLQVHLEWAVDQPWAGDYADEVPGLRRRAHQLLYPVGRRLAKLGACPQPGCGGSLSALVARTDDLLPSAINCDADPEHTWPSRDWIRLGRAIHGSEAA